MRPSARNAFLFAALVHHSAVDASAPANANPGTLVVPDPIPERNTHFGFLDDNGSNVGRFVETTTSGKLKEGGDTAEEEEEVDHQISLKDSKPRRGTKYHFKASTLTLLMAAVWSPLLSSPAFQNIASLDRGGILFLQAMITLFYFIECATSSTRKYLSNSLSPKALQDFIQQLKEAEPTILWDIECYHYRTVWRRQGKRQTHSREKVVTHRARHTFGVEGWRDVTSLDTLDRAVQGNDNIVASSSQQSAPFLKTTLAKLFVFTNPSVAERYMVQETIFKEREGRYDLHSEFKRFIHLNGFRHKILVVRTGLSDVAFASGLWFWISSFLGFTVPYRMWFSSHCQQAELTITKEIEGC